MARLFTWAALGLVSLFGAGGCATNQTIVNGAPQSKCWRYEPLTAAIASVAIDCQGTIGPSSFRVENDILKPTFDKCIPGATRPKAAQATLASAVAANPVTSSPAAAAAPAGVPITAQHAAAQPAGAAPGVAPQASNDAAQAEADYALLTQLLGFQQLQDLPDIHECIAGRWTRWSRLFARTNIKACPTWEKTEVIGEASPSTTEQYKRMEPGLPVAPADCDKYQPGPERRTCVFSSIRQQVMGNPKFMEDMTYVDLMPPAKMSASYNVKVPDGVDCKDPAMCAAQCVAAFPGFILAASGSRVDGDATYWLNDDPPMTYAGLTHPMAQYHGPPGDVYGHVNRTGETCWRWDSDDEYFFVTTLKKVTIAPGLDMSRCGDF